MDIGVARLKEAVKQNRVSLFDVDSESVCKNAGSYNLDALLLSTRVDRSQFNVFPLLGIEAIAKNLETLRLLSVGPRSELELFSLISAGFKPENLEAIDLISYSDLVSMGDMHSMDYPDDSFDVVILGWVWSYSRDWTNLANEIMRIAAPGAFVLVSADSSNDEVADSAFSGTSSHVTSCDSFLSAFGPDAVERVIIRHDSIMPNEPMNLVVFQLK